MLNRVVITHWVHPQIVHFLSHDFEVVPNMSRISLPYEEVLRRARTAHAVMSFMPDRIDRSFLDRCPDLRVIAGVFKGRDNVDVEACTEHGVWFTVVKDLLTVPTAELAVALLLALTRNVAAGDRLMRRGTFEGWRPILYGRGISASTIGIVGMGAVGRALACRLAPFEARVIYHDPVPVARQQKRSLPARPAALDDLLAESDYLVLAAPLTAGTFHMVDRQAISAMKKGACVINVARDPRRRGSDSGRSRIGPAGRVRGRCLRVRGPVAPRQAARDFRRASQPPGQDRPHTPPGLCHRRDKTGRRAGGGREHLRGPDGQAAQGGGQFTAAPARGRWKNRGRGAGLRR